MRLLPHTAAFFFDRLQSDTGPKKTNAKMCEVRKFSVQPAVHSYRNDVIQSNVSYKETVSCRIEAVKVLEYYIESIFMKYNVILN
jgi:hypothetical protein